MSYWEDGVGPLIKGDHESHFTSRPVDLELLRATIDLLEMAKGTAAEEAVCRFVELVCAPIHIVQARDANFTLDPTIKRAREADTSGLTTDRR